MKKRIYFLRCESEPAFIKIGCSLYPPRRQEALGALLPFEMTFLAEIEGNPCLEAALHRHLSDHRVKGEWFQDCEPVRAVIADVLAGTFDATKLISEELEDFAGLRLIYLSFTKIRRIIVGGKSIVVPDAWEAKSMSPTQLDGWRNRLRAAIAEQAKAA